MIQKQKFDWELAQKYVQSLPNREHTKLLTIKDLPREEKYYTFRFGEGDNDTNRPMGFPVASFRDGNGKLCVTTTTYNHHTLTAASSGCGKTQGVIMNCAFNADSRMTYVITDPKGEIAKAAYNRACRIYGKENVLVANFLNPDQSMVFYNPFTNFAYKWLEAEHKSNRKNIRDNIVSELKKIFEILFPVESEKDKSWERTAGRFILGLVLGLYDDLTLSEEESKRTGRMKTTPEMINFETLIKIYNSFKWDERSRDVEDGGFLSTRNKDSLAYTYTYSVISNAASTRANYLGFVDLYLARFSDPKILKMSSYNSLTAESLADSPKILFIVYDITHEASRDYVNVWAAQSISDLLEISHKQAAPLRTPVHLVLDEFASLRSCPVYPNLLATGRGSNIFMHMVVQSLEQLHARYDTEWLTMIDNCDVQFYLGSNSVETAKRFAESLGVSAVPDSESFLRGEFSISVAPIVSLDYLLHRMERGEAFVRVNNAQPIHSGFELYYKTPEYTAYPSVEPGELKSPFTKMPQDKYTYQLPKKRYFDFDDDDDDDLLFGGRADEDIFKGFEEEKEISGLQRVMKWAEEPFMYDSEDEEMKENFAMNRIEEMAHIDRNFSRSDAIELLKIIIKINKVESNAAMLDLLLNEFTKATDDEYKLLQEQFFDDE